VAVKGKQWTLAQAMKKRSKFLGSLLPKNCFNYSILAKLSSLPVQGATEWLRGDSVSRAGHAAVGAKDCMFV
jgi:hypothetical protein